MSTKRVKNIDLEDDHAYDSVDSTYFDDYNDGQDEMTEDDKLHMQEGTAKVRSLLGSEHLVSDKEIQDALWHYYYDVEKSVVYLKNLRKPKASQTPKKAKAPMKNGKIHPNLPPLLLYAHYSIVFQHSMVLHAPYNEDISWTGLCTRV
jgi:hypothetical protein